ncbi:DUF998 domain-containing protein [Polymorphospora sp. NPDC050346]|uniref:DUF998 domain-containing protein n=1 Tax=Polymorphospora sp. NPDC050346 TaxID=3155780 RepID=UPI00340E5616
MTTGSGLLADTRPPVTVDAPAGQRPGGPSAPAAGWYRYALGAVTVALVAGLALHAVDGVHPLHQMLSETVASPTGVLLLGVAAAALVTVAACLGIGIRRAGLRRSGPLTLLLTLWAAGLVALAVFPMDLSGEPTSYAGLLHRYGAGVAVAVPPLLGLVVAGAGRDDGARQLRAAAVVTAVAGVGFAAAHGPTILLDADSLPYIGLLERILLALVLVVLVRVARVLRDAGTGP